MKILVLGGQGFIGSHVINNLLDKDHSVTILDRRTDKKMWEECGWNDKDVTFRLGDIKDRDAVLKATNSTSTINRVPMRPDEDKTSVVEISEQGWKDLETHIGYTKEDLTPMDEAIKKSVEWYKEHLTEFPWDE